MAVPVIGSETSPPGRIIDQFEFWHMFMSVFSAFSFSSKESFTTSKTLGGAAALDEPLLFFKDKNDFEGIVREEFVDSKSMANKIDTASSI
jgi:hypothetical protein